jgi:hypothetical protein
MVQVIDSRIVDLVAQTILKWNQLIEWFKQMDSLRKSAISA